MFLYLLNDQEGKAFIELAVIAMKYNEVDEACAKAEVETFLTELNIPHYEIVGLTFEQAADAFKHSTVAVKRTVIIELCGILYADKEIDSDELKWIYALSDRFLLNRTETSRLIKWSKDFSDFLEVGLMYINAKL